MKLKIANALSLALIMAMLITSVGLADSVVNDIDTTIDPNLESRTITSGGSTSVGFFVRAETVTGDANGCNATGANPATVNLSVPAGVSASTSSLTFTGCGITQSVTFSSSTVGSYTIGVASVSGGKSGSSWDTAPASFTLAVNAPANTAPTLSLPSNMTVEATSSSGAVVNYTASAVDAEDNPDPIPSCSPASGSTFGFGATTVNCLVTDSGGKSASGSFTVTVQDTTAPIIAAHADVNAEATSAAGAVVNYTAPATSDAVDGAGTATCVPASGGTFTLGSTTVTCNVTDSHGNAATATTFKVTVSDTQGPALSLPTNISQEALGPSGNVVTYGASATDAVDGPVAVTCTPASGSTFPIAATTVSCSATDSRGNLSNGSFSVTIADTTAPVIAAHDDETAEATSAAGAIVNYATPATTDAVDGPGTATCAPVSGSQFALGDTTVTCNASDAAHNNATPTTFVVHVVDTTEPVITFVSRTPANGNSWNNGDVTVNWSCTDLVGVVSASVSETVSTEGANQSITGTCEDTSGNTASDTQTGINIDKTAPNASASASPAANSNGWNNSNVTVSFNGSDDLSGIDFCDAAVVVSSEGAGQSASGTCTDKAGNVSSQATASGINIDKTAPTASATAAPGPNANGWNKTDVTVSFTGDDGSGSGIDFCDVPIVLTAEAAGQSASGDCTDKAGNVSASASASGINIDKTNPTVSLVGGPANGGTYYFGFVPAAPTCNASDLLSGLDGACSVTGYSNAIGAQTVMASATDKAGNSAGASVSYTVLGWTLNGFYQPVDMGKLNIAKNGSTVPLKFEVFAGPTELTNTNVILGTFVQKLTCGTGVATDDIENYSTGGTSLRYDTTAGQFIFNWQTPKLAGNCYRVTLTTADGTAISADFKLK